MEEDLVEQIAVIGLAGRFPGARNIDQFWWNLRNGVESIRQYTEEELIKRGIAPQILKHPRFVKAGTILEDMDMFDASLFGYSPKEAITIDPQQRILLETAWEALEHAGYDAERFDGPIAVFAGSNPNDYRKLLPQPDDKSDVAGAMAQGIGNEVDFLSTRISYKLNLKGPSMTIQTGCSTSLLAVQLACQSLLTYQCTIALAGGVSINLRQGNGYFFQEGTISSKDGHCRAFDAAAGGTVLGQGVGLVVLKRLSEAIEDNDTIYAVIKGCTVNNDGALKTGYTAPSVEGQAQVIAMAHALSGVDPETITYVETHGTGTSLGDPIEISALTQAFRAGTQKKRYCAIGSVKTNIGHADAAAGIAGLIKTILMLKNKQIPASLHFTKPNPNIDFENSPFYVADRLSDWTVNGIPRRAGVSSFGIGGTNVHAIIEQAPVRDESGTSRPWQLLLLSAHTASALDNMTANLAHHIENKPDINIADMAFTLQKGRKILNHRRTAICRNGEDAVAILKSRDPRHVHTAYQEPAHREVVFLFPGQGSQYVQMGRELYQSEPVFRNAVDGCAQFLSSCLSLDIREIIYPQKGDLETVSNQLKQTRMAQPAIFTIEYALAKLWMSWGVHPAAFVGHSIGEYVAACLSGVFSLEDALMLVATRGRLMQQCPGGAMMAVSLSEKEIEPLLGQALCLASINGPGLCVVSGTKEDVADLKKTLAGKNVACRLLHTSHAFHSKMMEPVIAPFIEKIKKVDLKRLQIPIVSTVTGKWMTKDEMTDPDYWIKNLRRPVRFFDSVKALCEDSSRVLLEVGPGLALATLARQYVRKSNKQIILTSIRHPNDKMSDSAFILTTLGRLWLAGIHVNWSGFYEYEMRHRIPLPTYPFERQRYRVEPRRSIQEATVSEKMSYEKEDFKKWFYIPSWKRVPLPWMDKRNALTDQQHHWLVFLEESGVGRQIIEWLQQDRQHVTTVIVGEKFDRINKEIYKIDPRSQRDYKRLMEELHARRQTPDTIVHLWCLTVGQPSLSDKYFISTSQELGFYSLLFLIQAIDEQLSHKQIKIKIISNQLHEVTGNEVLSPEKATVLGPCRVAPQEYPNIQCTNIDMALSESEAQKKDHIRLLMQELNLESDSPVVAYRGKYRWVQTFEAMRLEKITDPIPKVREKGVYLITGGLGGIGLTLAEYLAQTVQAKIILIARTVPPERTQWGQWLATHKEQDDISRKILKLRSLEDMGAEVLIISADVTDQDQMKSAIDQACHRFGSIHGIIHAAGVAGGGMMQLKTVEKAEKVLAPKIKGTLVLGDLLKETDLDFFVLCSSIASLSGGIGQVDYCAANAFLDAYAHQNHLRSNTLSINWCAWQEVGMAVNTAIPDDFKKNREHRLKLGILPKEGQQAFGTILGVSSPQVIVTTHNFQTLATLRNHRAAPGSTEKTESAALPSSQYARPELSSVYVAPGNSTEETIAEIWQQLLSVEKVGINDNFFELGGHSLLVAQITSELRRVFKMELPLGCLFESPTVHLLSKMILEKQEAVSYLTKSQSRGNKRKEKLRNRVKNIQSHNRQTND